MKTETMELPVKLTDDQMLHLGRQLAAKVQEIEAVEAEKAASNKEFNERIKDLDAELKDLAKRHRRGAEDRPVECVWKYDYGRGVKCLIRLDIDKAVKGPEPLTDADRQKAMEFAQAEEARDFWTSSSEIPPNVAVTMEHDDQGRLVWLRVKKEAAEAEPASKAA
ncbi:MAG: hypothetical protein KJ621_20625 [Proteobacteria bacterium]|nr:hypothetical protein [Pseudomonadota bacterium]